MKPKRKVILFVGLIALVTVLTGTLGGCRCTGFMQFSNLTESEQVEIDDAYLKTFGLYKAVESRQGNESDDLQLQFQDLVLDRVKQQGLGEFKDTDDAEDAHFSELLKIYDDLYNELLQYWKLLSVIQGTWTRVNKSNSAHSWDDNGPQITLSIVGNHQVQLVRPQLDWVPTPDNKKYSKDFAVVGQATDQYTCRMGEPSTDKRYVGKPIMMLSQGGKDIIFIVLNEDNTITFNGAENISTEELNQRFGDESLNKLWLNVTYSKVQ